METVSLAYVRQQGWGGGVRDRLPEGRRAPHGGRFRPGNPGETELRPGTLRDWGRPAETRSPPPAGGGSDPAVTAVRAAAAASSPLPLRGSHRRGRRTAAAPTRVVDVQLVGDALVAPSKDDHQLPDGHRAVSVPGAGDRPREGGNPPPVEEAGSRHLPNPRPSVHNAPRLLRRRCSGRRAGTRLQLCTREEGNPTEEGDGHVTAGVLGEDGGLRGAEGVLAREPHPPRVTWLVLAPWTRDFRVEGNFLPTSLPSPSRASSFL